MTVERILKKSADSIPQKVKKKNSILGEISQERCKDSVF
jgi:hypothetical protein